MSNRAGGHPGTARIGTAEQERAIRATDSQWLQAVEARDLELALSFWSDDALILPPNAPAIVGKGAIRAYVAGSLAAPGFSISWETDSVWVSASADVAYAVGRNRTTLPAGDGDPVVERNKTLVIWARQEDGAWKCVAEMWNGDAASKAESL